MKIHLVHHADAVGPEVDTQRPLSSLGVRQAERLADRAKTAGCHPAAIWHSGKLRARQTAEPMLSRCNPFAEFKMMRGLGPDDPPELIRTALQRTSLDVMVVGHMPNLSALLEVLCKPSGVTMRGAATHAFPPHGLVTLESHDGGVRWSVTQVIGGDDENVPPTTEHRPKP